MLWSFACVLLAVYTLVRAWIRSGMAWFDFVLVRGSFLSSRMLHRWSLRTKLPIPLRGPAIVVSNHTCSADPTFLLAAADRGMSFLVAREHFNTHPMVFKVLTHFGCVPVTRTAADPGALRRALRRVQEGGIVCLFPEGNLSGVALRRLRRPRIGMAFLALATRAPVYPAYISGGPRTDELLKSWLMVSRRAVRVRLGKAIDLSAYLDRPRDRRTLEETAMYIFDEIEKLSQKT